MFLTGNINKAEVQTVHLPMTLDMTFLIHWLTDS